MSNSTASGATNRRDSFKSVEDLSRAPILLLAGAVLFTLAFQLLFYSTPLYNSGSKPEERLVRADLLPLALKPSAPGNPSWLQMTAERFSHFENLSQRLPQAGFAIGVWLCAWLAGGSVRRLVLRIDAAGRWEAAVGDVGLGMGAMSLAVLGLGLVGQCNRESLMAAAVLAVLAGTAALWRGRAKARSAEAAIDRAPDESRVVVWAACIAVSVAFAALSLLAALLPTTDYDALGYHLLGPKEWFERGRIEQLPHNVYTTFPFLTEMFSYAAMTFFGDWFVGGLAGQATLWGFGPATTLAVGVLAKRCFGSTAGCLAALAYISTPWTYRLSSIPYVEGALNFYAVAALLVALQSKGRVPCSILAGCLAGCAASCKYPGLVFVGLPTLAVCLWKGGRRVETAPAFLLGLLLCFGPWLARNYAWTGNPVFPLLASTFKTHNWPPEKAERFNAAHRSKSFSPRDVAEHAGIVAWKSDWQTPLAFAFAPLALLGSRSRRAAWWLTALVLAIFAGFWALTHRLDRFFLTLEPPLLMLAAAGMTWSSSRVWRAVVCASLGLSLGYHAIYCTSGLCGLPNYTADQKTQWRANWQLEPAVACANDPRLVRSDGIVLFVGYAGLYDCIPPRMYGTVFDDNVFEQLAHNPQGGKPDSMLPDFRIQSAFDVLGIDSVIVDWSWIKRYREPGNYGYSEFVQPSVFQRLCASGILTKQSLPPALSRDGGVELYRVNRSRPSGVQLKTGGAAE